MPTSPDDARALSQPIARDHRDAADGLLQKVARTVGMGLNFAHWADAARGRAGRLKRSVSNALSTLAARTRRRSAEAVDEAHARGVAEADQELRGTGLEAGTPPPPVDPGRAKDARQEIGRNLSAVYDHVEDSTMKRYHAIIAQVATMAENGEVTRLQAAARALQLFADEGIKGFVDRSGKRWELASYVEMAVRTTLANVMIDGHLARLEEAGVDLVYVSLHAYECQLCAPWEGKVLAIGGPPGPRMFKSRNAPQPVRVEGTIEQARAAGWGHPNCKHTLEAFIPGVTRVPDKVPGKAGVNYKTTQRLRDTERAARKWHRRELAALTEADRKQAARKVREWRARARELATSSGLPRKTHREVHGKAR